MSLVIAFILLVVVEGLKVLYHSHQGGKKRGPLTGMREVIALDLCPRPATICPGSGG